MKKDGGSYTEKDSSKRKGKTILLAGAAVLCLLAAAAVGLS